MTERGLYIVIEGTEGVGKTTQVELLAAKLRAQGRMVRIAREPDSQTDLTARAIRNLTQDPRYPMNTKTEVLLYNAARSQSLDIVRVSNQAGIDCIVDRSFLTTLAIQYYGRGDIKDYESIDRIIRFAVGDMHPDVMLILDAPVDALMERSEHRNHGERFDSLDRSFLERVRNGYLTEATNRAIPVIDAMKKPVELVEEIMAHIAYARGAAINRPKVVEQLEGPVNTVNEIPPIKTQTSYLAIARGLTHAQQVSFKELKTDLEYYRPENLGKKVTGAYDTILKKILQNYTQAVKDYSKYLATQAIHNNKPFKIEKLTNDARQLCRNLLPACILIDVGEVQGFEELEKSPGELNTKVSSLLPNIDPEPPRPGANLKSHFPKNEFEVLESIIFANSDQSSASIKQLVDELSYEKKAKLLKESLGKVTELHNVTYSFDISCELKQLFDLLKDVGGSATLQDLTPRNGYEIPSEIETAGLADLYQQSFDLSLELFSLLQAAGFEHQAQYATLLGHRIRCVLNLNFSQFGKLKIGKNQGFKPLAKNIKQQVLSVHPLLWGN